MLRKLFNMYSIQNNGNKVLNLRQINAFMKDFGFYTSSFFPKKLDTISLELIYKQKVPKKLCDFKNFIEILFKLSKIKTEKKTVSNPQDDCFKKMLDQILLPRFKELSLKVYEYNLSKIQVFYQHYDDCENPVVLLLYQNDDLLKHVSVFKVFCLKINRFFLCMKAKILKNRQTVLFQ